MKRVFWSACTAAVVAGLSLIQIPRVLAGTGVPGDAPAVAPTATTRPAESPLRVAIYVDSGAPDGNNVEKCLSKLPGKYVFQEVNGAAIRGGALDYFDVAVFPGGSGSGQAKSLQPEGREKVRAFVQRGGGYMGICGGSYLASAYYPWSLNIINAMVVDRAHWNRGPKQPVKLEMTPTGKQLLHASADEITCLYHQGPLLAPYDKTDLPAYETLATFGSEVTDRAPKGVMIGTTAIARAPFGSGHVLLISPHPEATPGLDNFIRDAVDWIGQSSGATMAGRYPTTAPTAVATTQAVTAVP